MRPKTVNYVFFGFRDLQGLQSCLLEPVETIQLVERHLPEGAEDELVRIFGDKIQIVESATQLKRYRHMRGFLLTDLKMMEDLFYEWTGRQDFPFVVTVKQSQRPAIASKNQLKQFHPNIDLLLRELVR